MNETKTQIETSASDTSIGFDYQFYQFFYLLLDLRHGQAIGIEVKDDVHIDLADGSVVLMQTKHTLQTNISGDSKNLTERDVDLWKTLSNWSKIIIEQQDGKNFLKKATFILSTNKNTDTTPFIKKLTELKNAIITAKEFKEYVKQLKTDTKSEKIQKYMEKFLSLKSELFSLFYPRIKFESTDEDLIQSIKRRLLEKIPIPERIDDVYRALHSELRDTNYLNTKAGTRNVYTFEDYMRRFGKCYKVGISLKLPMRELSYVLPDNPEDQLFVRQLVDIGDLDEKEKELIIEYTTYMLQMLNNMKEWDRAGDFLSSDRERLNRTSSFIHQTQFKQVYRTIKQEIKKGKTINELDDEIKAGALNLLDEMRKQVLKFEDTDFTPELSHGHFYLLTEEGRIGWHLDWENRYKL